MKIETSTGLLSGARQVASPNFDPRPSGIEVDTLVVHAISMPPGEYGGSDIEHLFCNQLDLGCHPFYPGLDGLTVSAHLLIRRDGSVEQHVPLQLRAWHAGVSEFMGRTRVNDFSIGIELEGSDQSPFEEAQYQSLVEVARCLIRTYPAITPDRVVGHADIAPNRKTDPGPYFNWQRIHRALRS